MTVYLTPWCPHCRAASANLLRLRDFLKKSGVSTRIVIGDDSESAVRDYAATFGPGTLLDPDSRWKQGGVPHLYVSRDGGEILKEMAGAYEDPIDPADFARRLGLP